MSKLTPAVQQKILDYVKLCAFPETACAAAGINVSTFRRWLEKAAKGRQPYKDFAVAVEREAALAETKLGGMLAKAAVKNHQAALALLQHRFRERWGRQDLDLKKELQRLVDIIADEVSHKAFTRILLRFGHRSTIED
jgi:hypothetical protein